MICTVCKIIEVGVNSRSRVCHQCEQITHRKCSECQISKPLVKFATCTYGDGRMNHCRQCTKEKKVKPVCKKCGGEIESTSNATKYCSTKCKPKKVYVKKAKPKNISADWLTKLWK